MVSLTQTTPRATAAPGPSRTPLGSQHRLRDQPRVSAHHWIGDPLTPGCQRSQVMDFMMMTIHPPPLLPPSYPHRLTFHLKGRMGKREARRTSFISENR
ncbi:unnamed protein product [Tetraodon nigroviridis]|uniref:(spotted green pufferfish) hypothetical protein n=1 Tax=Tetraodon nigroviridis TaxID=99883 RepID=Q4RUW0_TETNG|nr:unnamed protein product [Tetraodon nigroviridis]